MDCLCLGRHISSSIPLLSPSTSPFSFFTGVRVAKRGVFCTSSLRTKSRRNNYSSVNFFWPIGCEVCGNKNGLYRNTVPNCLSKKWKLGRATCFKHEEKNQNIPPSVDYSKLFETTDSLDEPDKTELDQSCGDQHINWVPTIQKAVYKLFKIHDESWSVPWTGKTVIQVMVLWAASFWFVGSWVIPFLAHTVGFRRDTLTHRGQALCSLLTDIFEALAGIGILHRCLSKFRPLPPNWFHFSLKGKWPFDVVMGCVLFPLVNYVSQLNIYLVPMLPTPPVGLSSVEQSIVARDPVAMGMYAIVVSVCAPIWEEIVFRGFLLPSLTRYMPLWASILVSSVGFALAHFNVQRILPLLFLGVIMGVVFCRSGNLIASMLLHSLWNGFVFLDFRKFNAICHFFGYQARGSLPSKFDCDYAYVLGHICCHILVSGLNGYMATVTNLKNPIDKWRCGAAPITAMMSVKRSSHGPGAGPLGRPTIHPSPVDLKGKAYEMLRENVLGTLMEDEYRNPGPIQFEGHGSDEKPVTLCVEDQDYMGRMKELQECLTKVKSMVKPGCSEDVLKAALSSMNSVTDVLNVLTAPPSPHSYF